MRYDRSALCGCIWWLHQRNEHVGNGFHGQSLQRLHSKVKKLSSNRLRDTNRHRCPGAFGANTLNIPMFEVGRVDRAALVGASEAFHVTAHGVIPINRSYRFYYFEDDWL